MSAPEPEGDRVAGCQLMAAFLLVFWLCVFAAVKRYYVGG